MAEISADTTVAKAAPQDNPKSKLQELQHKRKGKPPYYERLNLGLSGGRAWESKVWLDGVFSGEGHGNTKKEADFAAASMAIAKLQQTPS